MKIDKRDGLFVGLIVVVLAIFIGISGKEKTKRVPLDDKHRPFYETYAKTHDKQETEKGCETCHNENVIKFPPNHPPKNRCLLCHKFVNQ
ncbi:MAG: cytochrome C [Geobacteraceae bacterium]|nr:cytochrome C [Geobacteraceae bacterium]